MTLQHKNNKMVAFLHKPNFTQESQVGRRIFLCVSRSERKMKVVLLRHHAKRDLMKRLVKTVWLCFEFLFYLVGCIYLNQTSVKESKHRHRKCYHLQCYLCFWHESLEVWILVGFFASADCLPFPTKCRVSNVSLNKSEWNSKQ